jgi:hypothetical protein
MFNYTNNISNLAHSIIRNYCREFNTAVDATLGKGNDTNFLSIFFDKVYAFEIQKNAVDNYLSINNSLTNVTVINDSHEHISKYVTDEIDCIIYNLGFLPGGDKSITTRKDSTIHSIKEGLLLLKNGGLIIIAMYTGHHNGNEEAEAILSFAKNLSKKEYGTMHHTYVNRENNPPSLLVIEKFFHTK